MSDPDFTIIVLDDNNQELWTGSADDMIEANRDSLTDDDIKTIQALTPGQISPSLEGPNALFVRQVLRPLVDPNP